MDLCLLLLLLLLLLLVLLILLLRLLLLYTNLLLLLRSGELRTQKLKSHLLRTQSLKVFLFKPGVGQYVALHATLSARNFSWLMSTLPVYSPAFFQNLS